jgi:hypothetical protein
MRRTAIALLFSLALAGDARASIVPRQPAKPPDRNPVEIVRRIVDRLLRQPVRIPRNGNP